MCNFLSMVNMCQTEFCGNFAFYCICPGSYKSRARTTSFWWSLWFYRTLSRPLSLEIAGSVTVKPAGLVLFADRLFVSQTNSSPFFLRTLSNFSNSSQFLKLSDSILIVCPCDVTFDSSSLHSGQKVCLLLVTLLVSWDILCYLILCLYKQFLLLSCRPQASPLNRLHEIAAVEEGMNKPLQLVKTELYARMKVFQGEMADDQWRWLNKD